MKSFRLGMPWAIVAGFLALGLLVSVFGHVRFGGWLMALGLFAGALMRAAFPNRLVTDITLRSRTTDILGYAVLGAAVLVVVSVIKL